MAYIYLITNTVNGKVYIGKTETSIEQRFKEHICDSQKERCKNRPLYRAMNKYGVDKFTIALIEETKNPEQREEYWIQYYDSYHSGYNATRGGDGKKYIDYQLVVTTYNKLRNANATAKMLGISPDTVYTVIKQHKIALPSSVVNKEYYGKAIDMYDLNMNLENNFPSIKEAAKYLKDCNLAHGDLYGITSHIRKALNGKRKIAYGKQWRLKTHST